MDSLSMLSPKIAMVHVKSHQDRKIPRHTKLPYNAQLNGRCDDLATKKLEQVDLGQQLCVVLFVLWWGDFGHTDVKAFFFASLKGIGPLLCDPLHLLWRQGNDPTSDFRAGDFLKRPDAICGAHHCGTGNLQRNDRILTAADV